MKLFFVLTFALLFTGFNLSFAANTKSPCADSVVNRDYDKVDAYIKNAKTCRESAVRAEECALGSGIDSSLAGFAIEKCEKTFMADLNVTEKAGYNATTERCYNKYAEVEGSMYRSLTAFCLLDVAKTTAHLNYRVKRRLD